MAKRAGEKREICNLQKRFILLWGSEKREEHITGGRSSLKACYVMRVIINSTSATRKRYTQVLDLIRARRVGHILQYIYT